MRFSHLTRGALLTGALTLLSASVAHAASGGQSASGESTPLHLSSTATTHAASATGGGGSIVRTIVALVVVIAIIYAVARILRAVKGRDVVRASGNGLSQLATMPVGPNRSISLVRAGRDVVLVGITEHGVSALKTYTEAEALAAGIELPIDAIDEYGDDEAPLSRAIDGLRRLTVRS